MDPTEALSEIRSEISILRAEPRPDESDVYALVNAVEDLDSWMAGGGFPPEQWRRPMGRPRLTVPGQILQGVEHGRRKSYDMGCHCLPCRAANRLRRNLTDEEVEKFA
jgi:hypothetical protein